MVNEGEAVTAELVLDRARSHNVTFSVRTSGISARKGTDFGSGPFRVTVPAHQLRQSFTIPTVEDSEAEGDERFTLHFVTGKFPSWLSTGQTGVATVTIKDDDTQVGFASPRYPVTEGATATLTVAVKNGKQTEFMLGYTLVAGTASAADVTGGLTSGSVTVPADAASVQISVGTIQDGLAEGREAFTVELSTSESGVSFSRDRTKVVIEDDDPFPAVAFASAQRRVGEGAGTHDVTLQLAPAPAADLTLTYTVGGTATSGSDYAPLSGSLMVTAGSTAAAIPVTILDDATQDGRRDETVLLTLTSGTGYRVDTKNGFKLLITDNDPVPAVSFASASQAAGEGTGTRDVTLNLKPVPDADITVRYSVGGTASRGADYTALSGRITVPAGATAAAIPVTIADDTAVESSETIVLQLADYDARFEIADENARHTLTIVDNDTLPEAWFASASQTVDEGAGTRDIVVNLSRAAISPVTVNYTVSGTATAGADYTPLSGQVTVSAGKATAAIPVTILDDSLLDQKETVVVALAAGTGYRVGKQDRHTLTIADNEPVPVVWFANHRAILSEGAGRYDFVVNLWPAPIVRTTLRYEVCRPLITHGAATPGSDYGALSGSLTVEPGTTTAAIPVTIIDDDVEEQTEALGLCLIEGTNYTFSAEEIKLNKADLLIDDDDSSRPAGPEAAFVSHASYAGEGSGTHKVKVRLSPAPASAITLNYTVDGNSTATAGSDYGALSGSVSVPAGATTVAIPVESREDTVRESFETVILLLTAGTGYTLNSDSQSHWLYILDNDGSTPAASFASASATAGEMSGVRNVTVNLTPAPASAITLNYTVGGTATAGAGNDFTIAGAGTVSVAANARTATIAVSIEDDATREGSETVVLTLSAGTGYAVGGSGTHTLTIIDDESPAPSSKTMVSFASASSSAGEGSGTRDVIVNFAPPPTSRIRLFVSTNTATTTATKPADYTVVGGDPNPRNPFIVRDIPAGTRSASLRVTIHDDGAQEADETVVLQLKGWGIMQRGSASPSQDTVGSPSLHTLTIVDDDGAPPPSMPVASFAAAASSNDEGSGTSKVTVNLSPAPKSDITLAYTVAGTATAGSDYGALSGTVPVKAGTAQAILPVTIANDSAAESPETVVLTLTAGTGYTVGSASTHTLTIADDDPSLTVSFASDASTAREASGTHAVTLNISPAPEANLTLVYTVSGTATPDADYTALPGTLAVSPGTTSVSLPVAIIDDSVEDSGETVVLTLSAGAGYRLGNPKEHRLTIVNRDAPMPDDEAAPVTVSLSAEQRAIAEAYGKTKFRITLSRTLEAGEVVKVPFTITGGKWKQDWHVKFQDAHNGPGVTRTQSGRKSAVRFTEGGRVATLVLVARPNEDTEARTIAIAFGTGTRAPRATGVTGGLALMGEPLAVAIVDDDRGMSAVTVSASDAVAEGRAASFTLNADPAPAAALAVTVSISGTGDAVAPSALGERTVTLPGGTESQTFTVATVDDGTDGPGGAVTATVVKKAGYTLGETTAATVAVADDDATGVTLSAPSGDVAEAGGRKVLTVALARALAAGERLTVPLRFGGTADRGSDYTLTAPETTLTGVTYANLTGSGAPVLTFTGTSAASATVLLTATADTTAEGSGENVTVALGTLAATGLDGGAQGTGTVGFAILEPPPEIAIAAKTASVVEGGDAGFTVTASRAPDADLTVHLAVAEAGTGDFVAAETEGAATVTIPKGETDAAVTVATVNDAADEPDGTVTVTLAADGQEGLRYTVAASPGDAATVTVTDDDAAVTGPALSIADATAQESERLILFTVRLSPSVDHPVTVSYHPRDSRPVSARQGQDYVALGTSIRFKPLQTKQEIMIYVFDDKHNEDPETFELVLSQPDGATIADGVAVGTIVNSDPMPAAWLSRFGRTVAQQALDGIAGRLAAARTPGASGTLAGQAFAFAPGSPAGSGASGGTGAPNASGRGVRAGSTASGLPGSGLLAQAGLARAFGTMNAPGSLSGFGAPGSGQGQTVGDRTPGFGNDGFANDRGYAQPLTVQDVLLGSSFTVTGKPDGTGGSLAFWGRAAQARFDGREGRFGLDGEATTALLGADYARGRWLVGLALTQSTGPGGYTDRDPGTEACPSDMDEQTRALVCDGAVRAGAGTVDASLTAAVPYVAFQATERLRLWGAGGYGTGEVTLTPTLGGVLKADLDWTMAATGMQGDLLPPPAQGTGPALAVISDALWARTTSEQTAELAASDSAVTRLRLGLRGSWRLALDEDAGPGTGASLTPKLEIGARHDGGDAETGFGVELGGGVVWVDPALGLSLDLTGRTLLTHEDQDFADQGVAAAFSFDPAPATPRGPSLTLRQDWGGRAQGGLEALFAPDPLTTRPGGAQPSRWALEAAYGVPVFGGRFTGSPQVGLGFAGTARTYTVGWRLTPEAASASTTSALSFGFQAGRRESAMAQPEHTVGIEVQATW